MTGVGRRILPLARRALAYELAMWRSLFRWVLRRPAVPGGQTVAFGYASVAAPVIWTFIVLSAVEVVAVHLLLPWPTARQVLLVIGVYGLLWMVGLLAMLRVHPHLVGPAGLRIRHGATIDVTVPWDAVAAVRGRLRPLQSRRAVQVDRTDRNGRALHITMLSQTNVDVVLRQPMLLPVPGGGTEPVTEVRCHVDDARGFVARARGHLTAGHTR